MLAFDEARFGLINWHRRRYCPKGFRPPYIVRRSYEWTYLYAALEPTTGESFCLYLPGMDRGCLQGFLDRLSEAYPHNHLLVVLDGAPSHRSEEIVWPENVDFLRLPAYSPELDPVERWFVPFPGEHLPWLRCIWPPVVVRMAPDRFSLLTQSYATLYESLFQFVQALKQAIGHCFVSQRP